MHSRLYEDQKTREIRMECLKEQVYEQDELLNSTKFNQTLYGVRSRRNSAPVNFNRVV